MVRKMLAVACLGISLACTHATPPPPPVPTIAFVSTRDDVASPEPLLASGEIYLMNSDGSDARRLTSNTWSDGFPSISPDGRWVAFDSNRLRAAGEPPNVADLFVMNIDGSGQTRLIRGSSATWAPDSKRIAFHASTSGAGGVTRPDPGAAATDSDIFVMNVDDFLRSGAPPKNITNNPATVDDDADWSPVGKTIVFTSHSVTDDPINSKTAELFTIDAGGTGTPTRLTSNDEEERAPDWSPDGKRIVYMCKRGGGRFEICIINADGSGEVRLTNNTVPDLGPTWSPDGKKILFHRPAGGRGSFQIWSINADGTGEASLTAPPGMNGFPNWGETRPRSTP